MRSTSWPKWWVSLLVVWMSAALGCGGSSKPPANPDPESEPVSKSEPVPVSEPSKGLAGGEPNGAEPPADPSDGGADMGAAVDPDDDYPDDYRDDETSPRVMAGMVLLRDEDLGGLEPGVDPKTAEKILGKASKKGKAVIEEATGETVATWDWKEAGVSIVFSDAKKNPVVRTITLGAGSKLKTKAGIGIGSTLEELDAAYSSVRRRPNGDGEFLYLIGTTYVGMIFRLNRRAVTSVTWGTFVE